MPSFEGSTHQRFWILDTASLAARRLRCNQLALQGLLTGRRSNSVTAADISDAIAPQTPAPPADSPMELVTPAPGAEGADTTPILQNTGSERPAASPMSIAKPVDQHHSDGLSVDEDLLLQGHFARKIFEICHAMKYSRRLTMTAVAFFRRFYLDRTVMDEDPELMLVTCIYLAGKTEEEPPPKGYTRAQRGVHVEKLAERCGLRTNDVVENELVLMNGLNFHLVVYHPSRPLRGFVRRLREWLHQRQQLPAGDDIENSDIVTRFSDLASAAEERVGWAMLTDFAFTIPPSQLALACLLLAVQGSSRKDSVRPKLVTKDGESGAAVTSPQELETFFAEELFQEIPLNSGGLGGVVERHCTPPQATSAASTAVEMEPTAAAAAAARGADSHVVARALFEHLGRVASEIEAKGAPAAAPERTLKSLLKQAHKHVAAVERVSCAFIE